MKDLAKLHPIWGRLVKYVNTGEDFQKIFFACMNYFGTPGVDSQGETDSSGDIVGLGLRPGRGGVLTIQIHETGDSISYCHDVRRGMSLTKAAGKYRVDFRRVLSWIADGTLKNKQAEGVSAKASQTALQFVWE